MACVGENKELYPVKAHIMHVKDKAATRSRGLVMLLLLLGSVYAGRVNG